MAEYGLHIGGSKSVRRDAGEGRMILIDKAIACWNSMVNRYVELGTISPAKELLDDIPQRNVRYWDILAPLEIQNKL